MGSEQADDGPLLRAAQRGELAAFNQLVLRYQRQVYNLCYRTVGNAEDAADATQDCFFHAYRSLGSFQGDPSGFRGWLLRIAVNACYDLLRKKKRRPAESLDALEAAHRAGDAADPAPDSRPGPEQALLTAETGRQIQAALLRLPEEQRLVVVMCDVQGLPYAEVAAALRVELGTVKSRLSRARAALRDQLAARGELPAVARRLEQ